MCYSNDTIREFNVVAVIYLDCSSTKWNSVPNFIFLISIQLCDGNNVWTWILANRMETSCMYWYRISPSFICTCTLYIVQCKYMYFEFLPLVHSRHTLIFYTLHIVQYTQYNPQESDSRKYLQFCDVCKGFKAPRSHHCRKCGRCVMKMDHHCPYLNCVSQNFECFSMYLYTIINFTSILFIPIQCVGWKNHVYFTSFLAFSVVGCIHSTIILGSSIFRGIHHSW